MHVDVQFSVFLVNKPGVLAQVAKSLGKAKVNIVAMTMMDSSDHGVLRMVVDDADKVRKVFKKDHDYWTETDVLVMQLHNEPGVLATVSGELAKAHINISYAYTSGGAPGGRTTCVFKIADMKKGMKLLEDRNGTEKPARAKRTAGVRPSPSSRR